MYHGENHKKCSKAPLKDDRFVGDTGGEWRLDGIINLPAISQKEDMQSKEIQRSILKIASCIRIIKDGKKRNTNRLAGTEIHLKKKSWYEKESKER